MDPPPQNLVQVVKEVVEGSWMSFVTFFGLYVMCRLFASSISETYENIERDKKGYWCASMVSTLHAVLVTVLSIQTLLADPYLMRGEDFFYYSLRSLQTSRIFIGYIASDLVLSIYYRARWPGYKENLIHHILILITWITFVSLRCGQFFALVAHICELTTPFVNLRWFLYEAGLKDTRTYFFNGLAMVFLWFLTRILLYGYCGYCLVFYSINQVFEIGALRAGTVLFCYFAGLGLQCFWFFKMVRGAIKSLKGQSTEEKKKQ